ncbi:hypothetical protein D9M71_804620 [compost metagenome]
MPIRLALGEILVDLDHGRGQLIGQQLLQVFRRQAVTLLELGHFEVRPKAVILDRLLHQGGRST